ncbi:MAG: SUF system NifU family Fe-S cluster assembly protein [Spirochaetaceae bacterium]|nr:SUF system NifU family Fe-S cluster assembly protein [Spirochaetaceae bacterium]
MRDNDLYQELILDHYRNPRNCCSLQHPTHSASGDNPLCGDQLDIYLNVDGDVINEITFEGSGCAVSQASASLMTEHLKGHTIEEALKVFDKVHMMLTGLHPDEVNPEDEKAMGKLKALSGVAEFPMRVKCASLAWHTLKSALKNCEENKISTE